MKALVRPWRWIWRHHRCSVCRLPRPVWLPGDHTSCLEFRAELLRREALAPAVELRAAEAERVDRSARPGSRECWSCHGFHTGHVWCPHCSAPVDPGSREAMASPYWQADPRSR